MSKKTKSTEHSPTRPHWYTLCISLAALGFSGWSLWESHSARMIAYESAVPAISATVELSEPLAPGKQIQFKVTLDNVGKTPARKMSTALAFKFQKSDVPFEPTYGQNEFVAPTSDLAPNGHATLYSTNPLSLASDHDVEAVSSGQFKLYLYGKSTYTDIIGKAHEFHLCRYYEKVPGTEPLKLMYCTSYNETI